MKGNLVLMILVVLEVLIGRAVQAGPKIQVPLTELSAGSESVRLVNNGDFEINEGNSGFRWIKFGRGAQVGPVLNFLMAGGHSPVVPFPECGPGELPGDARLGCLGPSDCPSSSNV